MTVKYKVISTNEIIQTSKWKTKLPEDHTDLIEKYLNELGQQGWELVSVINGNRSGTTMSNTLFLKKIL